MSPAMSHGNQEPTRFESWRDFLRTELAPYPGRANFMCRMLIANALVITIAMTLQVPMTVLAVVAVISTLQSNMVLTRLIGVLTLVALAIAIATVLLLVKFTYDYPLLRITVASLIYLGCMYLMRALKLGIIFSGVGLVVIYAQSMVDSTANPELLTRYVLWAMVATAYGTIVTLLVNSFVLPRSPVRQMAQEAHAQLDEARERLAALARGQVAGAGPLSVHALQGGMGKLQKLHQFACMNAPRDEAGKLYRQCWIGVVSRIRYSANALAADIAGFVPPSLLLHLARQIEGLDAAIANNAPWRFDCTPEQRAVLERNANTVAMLHALDTFTQFSASAAAAPAAAPKEAMWQPDARTNPHYAQFALKALIASLIGYVFYTSTQWEGIHTIMLSVSLLLFPTLGMSLERMPLRFVGAMLGSLLAIGLTVFVMPHIDGIVGLLLMLTPVFLAGGWIGGGPDRTAYIGIQMIGTCCLPLLEGFGPSYDLTEVRDRAIGIVLGILISAVVFSCLWPESERGALRQRLAALLRQIGSLIRANQQQLPAERRQKSLVEAWTTLSECETCYERTVYERDFRAGPKVVLAERTRAMLDRARQILIAQDDVHSALAAAPGLLAQPTAALGDVLDRTGDALERYAQSVEQAGDVQPTSAHLSIAPLDAALERLGTPPQPEYAAVLTRLRTLLDEVASLPASEPASGVSVSRVEGPAP